MNTIAILLMLSGVAVVGYKVHTDRKAATTPLPRTFKVGDYGVELKAGGSDDSRVIRVTALLPNGRVRGQDTETGQTVETDEANLKGPFPSEQALAQYVAQQMFGGGFRV